MYYQKWTNNKLHAKSSIYNGIAFKSLLEVSYAQELDLRIKAKEIKKWEYEKRVTIRAVLSDKIFLTSKEVTPSVKLFTIIPDFWITNADGSLEIHEAKGLEMDTWKKKWAIFELVYGLEYPDIKLVVVKQYKNKTPMGSRKPKWKNTDIQYR